MAEYQNTIITNAGISVLNRVLANKATMTFTRAVSSTDDLSSKTEADLRNMTSLSNIMQNGICSSYDIHNQNMVSLDLVFTNEGLGNSYLINTVGLFAKPSDSSTEVLYAIARAGKDSSGNSLAEQMPAYVDSKLTKFTISLFTQVGQSSSVAVSITDEGVVKSVNGTFKPDANGDVSLPFQSQADANQLRDDLTRLLDSETQNRQNADNSVLSQAKAYTDASKAAWTPTVITTPIDLNTLTTCGCYMIRNGLSDTTNTPIPQAWLYVRVEGVTDMITQTLWKDVDPGSQWVRVFRGGNDWGNWHQITKWLNG